VNKKLTQTNKAMKLSNVIPAGIISGIFVLSATAEDVLPEQIKVQIDGAEVGKWTMDFDAAVEKATQEKLPMMINFTGSDWCGWCKLMDKGVFAQEEWKKFATKNVLLVTLDFPKDKNIVPEKYVSRNNDLKKQFGVRGFPTYVVLDSDGKSKLGQLGAGRDKTPASFIDEFKGVIRMSATSIEAFIKANPDKADAYKAAIKEDKDAKDALANWISTKPEKTEENNKKFAAFQERIKAVGEKLKDF
jgi:thioredoxin-related protein